MLCLRFRGNEESALRSLLRFLSLRSQARGIGVKRRREEREEGTGRGAKRKREAPPPVRGRAKESSTARDRARASLSLSKERRKFCPLLPARCLPSLLQFRADCLGAGSALALAKRGVGETEEKRRDDVVFVVDFRRCEFACSARPFLQDDDDDDEVNHRLLLLPAPSPSGKRPWFALSHLLRGHGADAADRGREGRGHAAVEERGEARDAFVFFRSEG